MVPLARESLPRPYVLARVGQEGLSWLAAQGFRVDRLEPYASDGMYCLADRRSPPDRVLVAGQVLFDNGVHRLFRITGEATELACGMTALPLIQPMRLVPRQAPALPDTVAPLSMVREIIDQVDLNRMLSYVDELSGESPALINGSPFKIDTRSTYADDSLRAAGRYAYQRFQRLGLKVQYHNWKRNSVLYPPNVVAEKPGMDPAAGIVVIGAHLDSTSPSASTLAPGADDNASGSVAVLTAAELLAPYHFDATIRFVLFTGEEQGLWGSAAYAQSVADQDIRSMLNLDMVAWDNSGGPDMDLHADADVPGSVALAQVFVDVVDAYGLDLVPVIYPDGTNRSDHASFWSQGFAAALAIENFRDDPGVPGDFNTHYHTASDRRNYYNGPYFQQMVAASLATLAHIAGPRTDCFRSDLNCDGRVDVVDIETIASRWHAVPGDWRFHQAYDINDDGKINIIDVQRVAADWGWTAGK